MKRQWDTKKQFRADYKRIAHMVFLGWATYTKKTDWRWAAYHFCYGASHLLKALGEVLLGLVLLATSPISFPLLCVIAKMSERRRRLEYLRKNRAADEDV